MVIIVQALLSGATVFLTGWCGKKIFSDHAGLIAAGLCAISSSLILYVPFHQNETVHCYLLTLLLFLTLRAIELQRLRDWCFAGLAAGVAILALAKVDVIGDDLGAAAVISVFVLPLTDLEPTGNNNHGTFAKILADKLASGSPCHAVDKIGVFLAAVLAREIPVDSHGEGCHRNARAGAAQFRITG
jgi:hypothetical protein